ncbi:CYTH domain-containing protein [Marinobacterium rhizophilum]|uniref:CYTH domain-containing protein n=1 Tax=Marinobacterium rhizophilum TaxID=420402 RepID=A0ABY5HE21_9GAMM|nr:CYTH domain-containing protein [Marinobacterium rhizophilum]UTW10591.1 CYTH domain-containing protein [Marinobacterium rhizophilum]
MAREVELKLSLDPQQALALRALPWLGEPEPGGSRPLHNQYFDTPDRLLAQHRVALRIREQDGRYIQTLKTRGSSQGGLHQRNEWEWDLPEPALDYTLLSTADWPEALQSTAIQRRIVPAFRTDFERTTWMLRESAHGGEPVLIELVLDQGEVTATAAGVSTALCELELELKQGTAPDLYRVAMQLAQSVPVLVSDISKAERGYRLLGAARERPEAALQPEQLDTQATFLALAERALTRASRGFDAWRGRCEGSGSDNAEQDWQGVETAALACRELQALLHSFAPLLPTSAGSELSAPLLQLNQQLEQALGWRLLLPRLDVAAQSAWAADQAAAAALRLDAVLASPATGRVLLGYGALLSRVC